METNQNKTICPCCKNPRSTKLFRDGAKKYKKCSWCRNASKKRKKSTRTPIETKKNKNAYIELSEKFYSQGCSLCSEDDRCCLDAHHTNPKEKVFAISKARKGQYTKKEIQEELEKCIVVCRNCHAKLHKKG